MTVNIDSSVVYKLKDGYQITKVYGEECSLVLKDKNEQPIAVLESCDNKVTAVLPYRGHQLTTVEKRILHKFIVARQYKMNQETAETLDVSILKDEQGQEEYLSERQVVKRLKERLNGVSLFIGSLNRHSLSIPAFSKGGIYNLSRAKVKKLVIEQNCDLIIDMRDNKTIEALRMKDSFTGKINLSRSTIESIEIQNNCRCDLTINESLRCFNLNIDDVYSGSLQIKNSCFHAIDIGFYSYADIQLSDNWGRRDVKIGNSFRGVLNAASVNVDNITIGNDCKGKISVSSKNELTGNHGIKIAEDFAGTLDVSGAQSLEKIEVGKHAKGHFNLLGCSGLKMAKFDRYFNGYADFSESTVEYVQANYGCSGELVFMNCENLALLRLPQDKNSTITTEKEPLAVKVDGPHQYYWFSKEKLPSHYFPSLYQKLYNNVRSYLSGEPE